MGKKRRVERPLESGATLFFTVEAIDRKRDRVRIVKAHRRPPPLKPGQVRHKKPAPEYLGQSSLKYLGVGTWDEVFG